MHRYYRCSGGGAEMQRWCRDEEVQRCRVACSWCECAEVQRCRGAGVVEEVLVQKCRGVGAELVQRFFCKKGGAEVVQRWCRSAEVWRSGGADMQRCRGAQTQIGGEVVQSQCRRDAEVKVQR